MKISLLLARMKTICLFLIVVLGKYIVFAQQETSNWAIGQNVNLDFSSGTPTHAFSRNCFFMESSASVSDESGNLLFYTDGDTVRGSDDNILPNGSHLTSAFQYYVSTVTQGSLFLKKPGSNNIYYLFSLAKMPHFRMSLSYSVIDRSLNGGIGQVISKNNLLIHDSLTEKMTAAKHCNNKDYWLVVINKKMLSPDESKLGMYESEFLSYLVTENGIQFTPQRSLVKVAVPEYGQMKFNSDGSVLACADYDGIYLFDFDKTTGKVNLRQRINVPLINGYGLEFSPNDRFLYINEKQYDLNTGILTPLMDYDCPSQWQRAKNGKLYKMHMPVNEVFTSPNSNDWLIVGNSNSSLRVSQVSQPDVLGLACQYDTSFIYEFHNNYTGWSMALPHFPSYHFYHPAGEFTYKGTCAGELFQFQLANNPVADSVKWIFDNGTTAGPTASHVFAESGMWQVSVVTFVNGTSDTISQCVTVCGSENVSLPSIVDLCALGEFEVSVVDPCIAKYEWSTGDTIAGIRIIDPGTYILKTTGACGIAYDTITAVKGACEPLTNIPNVFTPNADGSNDIFSIDLKNVSAFNYQILNRWGNLVKDSSVTISPSAFFSWNTFSLWDGESQVGKEAAEGVYFYLIRMETVDGIQAEKHGMIHLIR